MSRFDRITSACACFIGRPAMFAICAVLALCGAVALILGADSMVAAVNLSISVLTLLLLPILQASQNRDMAALQAKDDEIVGVTEGARDELIGLEKRGEAEIEALRR